MTTGAQQPTWKLWTGRVLSAIPALMLLFSASMKLARPPAFLENWVGKFGYPEGLATTIGVLEILCAVIYLVPKTRVLGAILLTGYLGGAVAAHVRIGTRASSRQRSSASSRGAGSSCVIRGWGSCCRSRRTSPSDPGGSRRASANGGPQALVGWRGGPDHREKWHGRWERGVERPEV